MTIAASSCKSPVFPNSRKSPTVRQRGLYLDRLRAVRNRAASPDGPATSLSSISGFSNLTSAMRFRSVAAELRSMFSASASAEIVI